VFNGLAGRILWLDKRLQIVAGGEQKKATSWVPVSLMATALAGLGVMLFRGCWHRKMSWPVRAAGRCYQVCTGCGIKRLFDEELFRAYGPYSYDLEQLIARQRTPPDSPKPEREVSEQRPAS
jgi:hypothetical protein